MTDEQSVVRTAGRIGCILLLSGFLVAGLPVGSAGDADGVWRYEGVWTKDDQRFTLHELRTLSSRDGETVWRAFRVMLDADGAAFSWHNETRWLDGQGATLRMNQTMVTNEGDGWRRIGIETDYDAACAGPPIVHRAGERDCSGTRTVLGKSLQFSERVTYEVMGVEKIGSAGAETTRIDGTSGSSRISYWWSDSKCSDLQEEVVAGSARLVLVLLSGPGCTAATPLRGPIVDAPDDGRRPDASATAEPDNASTADSPTAEANDGPAPGEGAEGETMESPIAPLLGTVFILVALLHVARRRQS